MAFQTLYVWLFVLAASVVVLITNGVSDDGSQKLAGENESARNQASDAECSGYTKGNPDVAATVPNCTTNDKRVGVVDHMYAFGFSRTQNPNWDACDLPELPQANHRLCYKTTIATCADGYKVYLNRRNTDILQMSCPGRTTDLPLVSRSSTDRFIQSPRYGCEKEDHLHTYRKSDFCLYNVSIPDCASGKLVVDNKLHNIQELERRIRNVCSDYVQFYHGQSCSVRYCGTELSRIDLEIPTTNFLAVFWTDTSYNKLGFKLRVRCA